MFRFVMICLALAGVTIGGVLAVSVAFPPVPDEKKAPPGDDNPPDRGGPAPGPQDPLSSDKPATLESTSDDSKVRIYVVAKDTGAARPLIIQDGRILPLERQEVPSERDGKLLILGTPVDSTEFDRLPKHRRVEMEVPILGTKIAPGEKLDPKEQPIHNPEDPNTRYRRPRVTDSFEPGTTTIIRQKIYFRKLSENDRLEEGNIVGVINPAVALEELAVKQSKLDAAAADVRASGSMKQESERRLSAIERSLAVVRGSVTEDDRGAARVTVDRYRNEETAKKAAVVQAQRELSAAWTTLDMYLIRAAIPGQVRTIYKHSGDAVKALEPVLQLQNDRQMRVEAQIEVQDALPLRERVRAARKKRADADQLIRDAGGKVPAEADRLRKEAAELVSVEVEASRPEPPIAAMSGHLAEVSSVAVSRGKTPWIFSGGEDGVVRVWERITGQNRWQETMRLDHGAPVRALACVGPKSRENLVATGTSTGRGRFFDLGNLKGGDRPMKARHAGVINVIAFNQDGSVCATGGDDRAIYLHDPATGDMIGKKTGEHRAAVTALAFTPDGRLVSAGRDKRLIVWKLSTDGEGKYSLQKEEEVSGRSGDVAQIGLHPTGESVLFDENRELRVLSLKNWRIEGSLSNTGATGNFSTFALFSPGEGKMILTNGNAPGRLQLWRAPSDKARTAELRQMLWSTGTVTCAAFAQDASFLVTGTSDHRVLVWAMPEKDEAEKPLPAELTYVEDFLDTSLKRVTLRASLQAPEWLIAGANAAIVVPPTPTPVSQKN
jgi:WD40 repeat protein